MHKTKNDLPEKVRVQMITLLQERLAEALESERVDEAELAAMEAQENLFPRIDPGLWRSS